MATNENDKSDTNRYRVSRRSLMGAAGGLIAAGAAMSAAEAATAPARPAKRFEGRVAVITGGARGVGRGYAEALAREGADIVICDILEPIGTMDYPMATQADMDAVVKAVKAEGRRCLPLKVDVRDGGACKQAVDRAAAEFGRIDFLIANAGIFRIGVPVAEMSDEAWGDTMRTNVDGVFHMMRAAIPHMQKRNFGRIIVTSSQAGRMGLRGAAHYSASKWAVLGLVKSVALEVARQGITVNAICPGSIATGISINPNRIRAAYPGEPNMSAEEFVRRREAEKAGVMGITWLHPEDVAGLGLFLLSDEGRFMTGEVIGITLGNLAGNSA